MKCLLVSDLHYNLHHYDWLTDVASNFDVLVIAGDLLDVSSPVSPQAQISVVLSYLNELKDLTNLVVSSGNHDLNSRNENGEKYTKWFSECRKQGIVSDGDYYINEDVLFTVYPWWDGPDVKNEIIKQLEIDSQREKNKWIWVYHPPPADSPTSWNGRKHYGDEDLLEWIEKYGPDLVFGGHVHQAPFSEDGSWVDQVGKTLFFNPGKQIGQFPTHIILDPERLEAVWFSIYGNEIVSMDNKLKINIAELEELPDWLN